MNEFCIIGAGPCGIALAKEIGDSIILEKSRAVGGRLAARRLGSYSLNHGPQELQNPATHETISDPHGWIKHEAEDLTIHKSWEVSHLELLSDRIKVISNQGQLVEARKIILTVPAPQAQIILNRSSLPCDFLKSVRYKKVIQFMLLTDSSPDTKALDDHIIKKSVKRLQENRFIALYEIKGSDFDVFFEKDKEEIKSFCIERIKANVLECHVHKWRYSEVITSIDPEFQTIFQKRNIFLVGDYFGTSGFESSLQSIQNILPLIKK